MNKVSGLTIALKTLKKESVAAMKHVDHIVNERSVLFHLTSLNRNNAGNRNTNSQACPFVINCHSSFQDDDNLYFELDYVEGITLAAQLRQNSVPI